MSEYGHAMEREYSASLSSGEESDMGSEFRLESVIYMTSYAATIFIGALVTVGVLLMTILISLVVMLQSCESRNSGDIKLLRSVEYFDNDHYDYCKMAYLHAELNNFESYYLPEICKDVAIKYIKDGHYLRDLSTMGSLVEDYFKNVTQVVGGRDVVLVDIDDLLSSGSLYTKPLFHRFRHYGHDDGVKEAKHLKHVFLLQIYMKLWYGGWSLVLCSREHEKQRGAVIDKLVAAGCGGWSELIMRSDEETKMDTGEYFLKQMAILQEKGYHIRAVISSRMDILVGSFIRTQLFKLPNPLITPEVES
ncbi:acid phosphatase, class B-like protein [Artemisia annua]|uniref:Acid phosphatase, class B-like protein n=1 Tax=Artemisia annua TaxID=35608 RepID=A0A2U1PWQ0_ARTAN|nr:acid phosphatase, class B-like protein [Artemisia annua]